MDRIIEGLLAIVIAIVLVVYEMIDTIRCKFDSHKWKESEDGMEKICERCGISYADYSRRQRQHCWFRFLAFLRSNMKRLKEYFIGPTENYTKKGYMGPFDQPTNWNRFGTLVWKILEILGVLLVLSAVYTILIKLLS